MSIAITKEDQDRVLAWVVAAFGLESLALPERIDRIAEEMAELAQAAGVKEDRVHEIVTKVYRRPIGELPQEIGGLSVTLIALAASLDANYAALVHAEIERIHSKPLKHFRDRQNAKAALGMAVPASSVLA